MRWDRDGFLKPEAGTRVPESFAQQCPFSPLAPNEDDIAAERFAGTNAVDPRIGRFEAVYVGHVCEAGFRPNASSGGLTSWVAAELLRTSAVEGKTSQRITAAREEFFTEWNAAICERLSQANANAVSPNDVMKLFFVKGSLQIQFCEVHAGAELDGVEIKLDRTQDSAVLIKKIVAGIASEVGSES